MGMLKAAFVGGAGGAEMGRAGGERRLLWYITFCPAVPGNTAPEAAAPPAPRSSGLGPGGWDPACFLPAGRGSLLGTGAQLCPCPGTQARDRWLQATAKGIRREFAGRRASCLRGLGGVGAGRWEFGEEKSSIEGLRR